MTDSIESIEDLMQEHKTKSFCTFMTIFASDIPNADPVARCEYETIQRLQKAPWLPRLMESFQEAPEYPGELYYFSLVDPAAPTIEKRDKDQNWKADERANSLLSAFRL